MIKTKKEWAKTYSLFYTFVFLILLWFMTQTTDNIIDRDELQDKYIQRVIDSLDLDDCLAMLYDYIDKDTSKLSLNELIEDVEEYYPELLISNN